MNRIVEKNRKAARRKAHIRKRVSGTPERPRMTVFRSNLHMYVQVIDDTQGRTLVSASTVEADLKGLKNCVADAAKLGETVGKRCLDKNIQSVVFDRNGYIYHGIVGFCMERAKDKEVKDGYVEKLIKINRVTKVVKGGKNFSFSALVVVGYGDGRVGYGFGKANDVSDAIRKATEKAKASLITVPMKGSTIPHEMLGKYKSASVLVRPAVPGTGVIAGGAVKAVADAAGIKDMLSKSLGSKNNINTVKATFDAFENLFDAKALAKSRGKSLKEMWG